MGEIHVAGDTLTCVDFAVARRSTRAALLS